MRYTAISIFFITIFISGCINRDIKPPKADYYRSVDKRDLEGLKFSRESLATIKIDGYWYYVKRDGKRQLWLWRRRGDQISLRRGWLD